jgi:hypothetical protein
LAAGDGTEKARSNSRRAKANRVSNVSGWAGAPGTSVAAKGLRTLLTKLETIPTRMSAGSVTVVVVLMAAVGRSETLTSAALCIVAAVFTGVEAAADTMGVVAAGVCTASATTRVASILLVGAGLSSAGAFTAAEVLVVFAAVEPDAADAVVGCVGALSAVIADSPLDSAVPPRVSGAGALEVSGVAVVLADAVAAVGFGSDPSPAVVAAVPADGEEPVDELVGELVCRPPVPTAAPASAERFAGYDADGVADADLDRTWLVGDFVDFFVDSDAVEVWEADESDIALVPEVAAPFDGEVESDDVADLDGESGEDDDGESGEVDDVDSGVSADATPEPNPVTTAAPTPKATANPPTRPTCAAAHVSCLWPTVRVAFLTGAPASSRSRGFFIWASAALAVGA